MSGNLNNTNWTNLEPNSLIFTLGSSYILAISVLGIIFNAFVLMVFCFHEKACTIAEIYLSNLAGADFVLVCCLPFWADYVGKGFNWAFNESLCKVIIQALRNRPNGHGTEQKATTLILVVLLAFLICWGPFQLSRILDLFERLQILKHVGILGDHKILVCKQITVYLAFFNSVLNPILYVTIGKNFQKKAKELFISRKYKKTRRSSIRFSRTRFTSVKSDIGSS
ncbi:unnamed protein product [Oreochromis niloticus]|nr:unnamed protein product [Mustela putorius furo]